MNCVAACKCSAKSDKCARVFESENDDDELCSTDQLQIQQVMNTFHLIPILCYLDENGSFY